MVLKRPYIIAETAYTFEGDAEYLLNQTKKLPESVDAIKYHMLFDITEYMDITHSVFPLLKSWMISEEEWTTILKLAKDKGHDVIILADDTKSILYMEKHIDLVDGIEVHAACVNDKKILDAAISFSKKYGKTLFLGISGFEITEIFDINEYLNLNQCSKVVFMYGFQNYPTKIEDIQLNKIPLIRKMTNRIVGYADHTGADEKGKEQLIETAYALGAYFQEIHYTLVEGEKRTDAVTALSGEHIANIKESLNTINAAIGNCDLRLNDGEKKYLNFRKVATFVRNLKKGHIISIDDYKYIRIEKPLRQHKFEEDDNFIGKKLTRDVCENEEVSLADLK